MHNIICYTNKVVVVAVKSLSLPTLMISVPNQTHRPSEIAINRGNYNIFCEEMYKILFFFVIINENLFIPRWFL